MWLFHSVIHHNSTISRVECHPNLKGAADTKQSPPHTAGRKEGRKEGGREGHRQVTKGEEEERSAKRGSRRKGRKGKEGRKKIENIMSFQNT